MRLKGIHIVALGLVLALLGGCRGPKLISKSEMKDIYMEMFMLDQRLKDDRALKRHADTMLVYEGLLEAYGYTTDDYLYSVAHYLKDPERYAKLLKLYRIHNGKSPPRSAVPVSSMSKDSPWIRCSFLSTGIRPGPGRCALRAIRS